MRCPIVHGRQADTEVGKLVEYAGVDQTGEAERGFEGDAENDRQ